MSEVVYKYKLNSRVMWLTLIQFFVLVGCGFLLKRLFDGEYMWAWFVLFVLAVVALMLLSVPRKIVVTDEVVEVRCLLDITHIERSDIVSVRRIPRGDIRLLVPILGGYGFFGYYGRYFDFKRFESVKIYATEWKNFVEIVDIYEDRLYVSCSDADALVAELSSTLMIKEEGLPDDK